MKFASTNRPSVFVAALGTAILISANSARAASNEAALLIEADTGKVLYAENATVPWYPASLTKLMTAYVTLQAVKNRRVTLDSLFAVSARAASQAPSKMGFKAGSQVTVDNALKMLMVKSANDMAVVLAEGVSGSVESFSAEMTQTSRRLGMIQSSWVNPNGLPADEQISSARDLAILARALLHDFPEYDMYWSIPAIQIGKKVMRNYNTLIGRYDGADGMKTGFICASGFNLVASATRNNKRLIAVVLGAKSSPYRGAKAAGLLERGFNRGTLSWLTPSLGAVEQLQPANVAPPDLRDEMCGPHRKRPAAEEADDDTSGSFMLSSLPPSSGKASTLVKDKPAAIKAVAVYLGAAKKSAETQFADARAKLAKQGKGKAGTQTAVMGRDPHTAPLAEPQAPVTTAATAVPAANPATRPAAAAKPAVLPAQAPAPAPAPTPALQTATAPPPGVFAPPPSQPGRFARAMPGASSDLHNPSLLSFAPAAAQAAPAPLTATPDAMPAGKLANVPLPRPRPKL
ncbi:MAG: D-alanyl-D-alanine carboxypeptidase, partial [Xanthobacteraceae bacterium]|nr:D-alanyl-D-alanine carboxypeptidase [Xanthobacteraceae bacterium]